MQKIMLAKMGAGAKVHLGYAVMNDNGTVHHVATYCNHYPGRTTARLIDEFENAAQVTCPKCAQYAEWAIERNRSLVNSAT